VNPGREHDYALDFLSVLRYVVTQLYYAAEPPGVEEMATAWMPVVTSDLSRVRGVEGFDSDTEAKRFLIRCALDELKDQVVSENGGYRLAVPVEKLRYERKRVHLDDPPSPWPGGRGVIDKDKATFGRLTHRGDLKELRESMQAHGWLQELPALQDETGFTLVGNRRMAVAKELGIEPVIRRVKIEGTGDEKEARKMLLAIASNVAAKPFTKEHRQRLIEHYGMESWTQVEIARVLNVSQQTVSDDLAEIESARNTGSGKSSTRKKGRQAKLSDEDARKALEMLSAGETKQAVAETFDTSRPTVDRAIARLVQVAEVEEKTTEQEPSPTKADPGVLGDDAGFSRDAAPPLDDTPEVCPQCGRPFD
jgi:ParB-like chromosome segregation protein Spo0J